MFFVYWYGYQRDLHVLTHPFPTRRSSDLNDRVARRVRGRSMAAQAFHRHIHRIDIGQHIAGRIADGPGGKTRRIMERQHMAGFGKAGEQAVVRSEEHTSELQLLMRISYAVFCMKKKHITLVATTV